MLCDYLTVAGLLAKDGDRYALTADSAAFLDRGSPSCVASAADFIYAPEIRAAFADVALAVRRGGTALPDAGTVAPEHPVWVRFARAMAPLMRGAARAVVATVEVDEARPLRILDVAAGHGMFGIAFAMRYPRAEVTGLDWPERARGGARRRAGRLGRGPLPHDPGQRLRRGAGRPLRPDPDSKLPPPLRSADLRAVPRPGAGGARARAAGR